MDDIENPRCPECGTVMRDVPAGLRCGGCGHFLDRSAEYAKIVMPPEFEGPTFPGA